MILETLIDSKEMYKLANDAIAALDNVIDEHFAIIKTYCEQNDESEDDAANAMLNILERFVAGFIAPIYTTYIEENQNEFMHRYFDEMKYTTKLVLHRMQEENKK